jgi:hypothetical protein
MRSVSFMEHENDIPQSRFMSVMIFRHEVKAGPRYLRGIQFRKITVVDHLGRNIPIPTIFCSDWKV